MRIIFKREERLIKELIENLITFLIGELGDTVQQAEINHYIQREELIKCFEEQFLK